MFNNVSKKQPWIPLFAILMLVLAALVACGGEVSPTKVGEVANPTPTVEEQEAKPAATQAPETESVPTDTPAPQDPTTSQTPIPEPSFQKATYQDTTNGFEFDYPSNWAFNDGEQQPRGYYVQFYSWNWQPGEIVEPIPLGETILQVAVNYWDPKNDLEAFVTQRTRSWDSSMTTILSEERILLADDQPAIQFTVQGADDAQSFFLFTTVGDQYLTFSGGGDLNLLAEIAHTFQAEPTSFKVDGRIVFADQGDVFVINADGTQRTQLTEAGLNISPACSPDGQHITFASDRDGNWEIYVMKANGSEQTRLTDNAADDVDPTWSPDGTRIAFVSTRDGNSEIYVMNADGSVQERLMNDSAEDGSPDWSPDGKKIAFVSYRDDRWQIYVMSVDGTEQTGLATGLEGHDHAPAWSPDGSLIAFWSFPKGENDAEIYVMNVDGSGVVKLTDNARTGNPANDYSPAWSPDGRWIAFYSDRSANFEVYVMKSDGSEQIRLVEGSNPCWLP